MYSQENSEQGSSLDFKLPSRFKHGDSVVVFFGSAGLIKDCTVIKIHFTASKVFYDVEVKWTSTPESRAWTDRLYNLDSANVYPPEELEAISNVNAANKISYVNIQDELPPPFTPVIIKRNSGELYFGFRTDAPLSVNPDASQECRWYGNSIAEEMDIERFDLKFRNNFSDVTVAGWANLSEFVSIQKQN